mmetsp:Transcript_13775/g.28918  ORF Transcript_13775/g.28918 Transcript_13775/m.28918 type:complete len:233 (-) Transcript_13775:262-960(-)
MGDAFANATRCIPRLALQSQHDDAEDEDAHHCPGGGISHPIKIHCTGRLARSGSLGDITIAGSSGRRQRTRRGIGTGSSGRHRRTRLVGVGHDNSGWQKGGHDDACVRIRSGGHGSTVESTTHDQIGRILGNIESSLDHGALEKIVRLFPANRAPRRDNADGCLDAATQVEQPGDIFFGVWDCVHLVLARKQAETHVVHGARKQFLAELLHASRRDEVQQPLWNHRSKVLRL